VLRVGFGQFEPGPDPAANLDRIGDLADQAASAGVRLLVLPEGSLVNFIQDPEAPSRCAEPLDGPFVTGLQAHSARTGLAIIAGTFTPGSGDPARPQNTLVVVDRGALIARYDKLHLYDAFAFAESDGIAAGTELPPVVTLDGVTIGVAICYDLRFPELFRTLTDRGAQAIAVVAAWVAGPLKEEHWLTLLRARAIENTSYLLGAGQAGRAVIGRSVAFDPLGLQLADLGTASDTLGVVDVRTARVDEVRALLPCLANRRLNVSGLATAVDSTGPAGSSR
jgi:deaminated glutathione amidase